MGLVTVVDLRGSSETGRRDGDPSIGPSVLDGITVVSAPTEDHDNAEFRQVCFPILDSPEYWPHNLRILPHLVLATSTAIAAARPGVLVHCSAGGTGPGSFRPSCWRTRAWYPRPSRTTTPRP